MQSGDSKMLSIYEACRGSVRNPFNGAREVGCYSVDAEESLHLDDRTQMKYYIRRNIRNLRLDLNVGYEDDIRHLHDRVKIMNNLLRWIENSKFEPLHEHSIHFVCTRGVIKKLLNTPYTKENWTMCACRLDDVIYLNIVDPDDHFERQLAAPEHQKRSGAWGYKFEQYMTADHPDGIPDTSSTAHQIEKFYIVVKNTIGPYNLLISAETDGVDPSGCDPGSGDPSCHVEMKLSRLLRDSKTINIFKRHKLRDSWSQAVCSGTEKIICGFRDEEGIVTDIKVYNTSDLPLLCENMWSPRVCINFCHNVLHYLRKRLTVNDPRIVYRCEYSGGPTVSVSRENNPTGPFNLIPDWYEAELQKC